MIGTFKKIWEFSGEERGNINKSVAVSFLNAVFHMFEIGAIYFVVMALTNGDKDMKTVWISLAFMVVSIIGNAVTSRFSKLQQTHAGYFMAANRRVSIGNRLKSVPMGFFNENSLGEVTGVCTTVLGNIENLVPMTLVNILGGVIGTVVFTIMILIFDWRIGLIAAAGIIVYLLVVSSMEKKSAVIAPNSQKSQTALVETVLEYVQGMGVIKSFNLSGRGDKNLQDALEYNRKSNLGMEQLMTPYTIFQELVLQIAGIGMMLAAVVFWINGTMTLVNTLMVIIMSFLVFGQIKLFGMGISMLRLADSSIERTLQTEDMYVLPAILNMVSVLLVAMVIRLFPIFMLGYYIIESTSTDEFVAAMEKWHVPEAFIIPITVVFRFIPTLGEESAAITDAMRMREIQFGTKKFWQNPTALLEYRVIPLMMSVVKIGDELSAAALTRGLGGLNHRTSIAHIGFTVYDLIIAVLSAGLLVWACL